MSLGMFLKKDRLKVPRINGLVWRLIDDASGGLSGAYRGSWCLPIPVEGSGLMVCMYLSVLNKCITNLYWNWLRNNRFFLADLGVPYHHWLPSYYLTHARLLALLST